MTDILYWVWLTSALGYSASAVNKVLYKFTPEEAYAATVESFRALGISESHAAKLSDKSLDRAKRIIAVCDKKNIKIICSRSPDYPRALDRLDDKPHVLYVRGNITCLRGRKTAAFIGTRRMSQAGEAVANSLAERLIDAKYLLVSGIAEGVDTVAAEKSLERGLPTVAVLGVDIDKYYPRINEGLIDRVAETGAVISEYPPETNARYFATRNRIIVGLSDILTVAEAPAESGALIGARLALKKKIPTYTVDVDGESFDGCRELISLGARDINRGFGTRNVSELAKSRLPVTKAVLTPKSDTKPVRKKSDVPEDVQGMRRYIWQKLIEGPKADGELIDAEHGAAEVLCALTELELDGYIDALPGGKYTLK